MTGTGTMYAGLCLSYVSIYQMLRGSVIIFTCVASVIFLRRKIYLFQWFSVLLVVIGVSVVGYVSLSQDKTGGSGKDQSTVLVGDILIIVAQIFVAIQMCVEEKLMSVYPTPALKVVGLEGIFGCLILGTACVPMYFIHVDGFPIENVPDAVVQVKNNPGILLGLLGTVCSISFFNYFGISVTQNLSAAHRMVLDSVRTLVVWAFSVCIGWEKFHWLQLIGFIILTIGTAVYNEIIILPCFKYPTPSVPELPLPSKADNDQSLPMPNGGDQA